MKVRCVTANIAVPFRAGVPVATPRGPHTLEHGRCYRYIQIKALFFLLLVPLLSDHDFPIKLERANAEAIYSATLPCSPFYPRFLDIRPPDPLQNTFILYPRLTTTGLTTPIEPLVLSLCASILPTLVPFVSHVLVMALMYVLKSAGIRIKCTQSVVLENLPELVFLHHLKGPLSCLSLVFRSRSFVFSRVT